MRPLIAIPCHPALREGTSRPIYGNNRAYVHAVESAGGVPVLIPLLSDLSALDSLLSRMDGLLLPGGLDIQPHYYNEEPHAKLGELEPRLDEFEFALAQWAITEDIPTLGICRGMQLMNVALGGSLYQDLATHIEDSLFHPNWEMPRNTIIHEVYVEAGTQMERILGQRKVEANSLHHQGVKNPGKGVRVSGRASDGVVELIEVPEKRFMVGAQCHPEELYSEHDMWHKLFAAFVAACVSPVVRTLEKVEQAVNVSAR